MGRLTRKEWSLVRAGLGKPRRLSLKFLKEERARLEAWRESVRAHYAAAGAPGAPPGERAPGTGHPFVLARWRAACVCGAVCLLHAWPSHFNASQPVSQLVQREIIDPLHLRYHLQSTPWRPPISHGR